MAPANLKDAIVIVFDVGKSVSIPNFWETKTFFQQAKDCLSWIIQRKIISQSKDALALLLIGSTESNHNVDIKGYDHINCKFDFQYASWELLKFVETEMETTENDSDWVGGLIVSLEMLRIHEKFNNIANKKIVFFSDFAQPASDDMNIIARSISSLKVEITIIGPDFFPLLSQTEDDNELDYDNTEDFDEPRSKKQKLEIRSKKFDGKKLMFELWRMLPENIGMCTFESALKQLGSYSRKTQRLMPWNCALDIGDIKISISMFKKTDPKFDKKLQTRCVKSDDTDANLNALTQTSNISSDDVSQAVRDKVMYYKHDTGEGKEFVDIEVKPEDTIEGYRYGTTVIPFSEEDKTVMEYKPGPKCFSVIGFTSISSIPYYLLSGECSYVVLPKDGDKHAEVALSAFINGMKNLECLAVTRKVYSDNRGLSLGILYPIIEEIVCDETDEVSHKEYLLFIELAFKEDVKSVTFPSLRNVAKGLTEKQLEAVDNLMNGMNLMKANKGVRGEPCEAFDSSGLHDIKEQFFQYCVVQKGLYPENPLPTSLPSFMKDFIRQPKEIEEKCKKWVAELKKQFKIESKRDVEPEGEKAKQRRKASEDPSTSKKTDSIDEEEKKQNEHFSESSIIDEKDSVTRLWMTLFSKAFPTDLELESFLTKCLKDDKIEKRKLLDSFKNLLTRVRRLYLRVNPDLFNWWMTKFKGFVSQKEGIEIGLWEIVVSENLGLISKKENRYSIVSEDEAEAFLCEDVTMSDSNSTPKNKKPDFKPLPEAMTDLEIEQMNIDSIF